MANWAYVENDVVKEVHETLPISWKNISGLNLSENNLEFLLSINWYPVEKQHQQYDKNLYFVSGLEHKFVFNKVVETLILKKSEDTIKTDNNENLRLLKESFLINFLQERNKRLRDTDWTQLADVQHKFNSDDINRWNNYRQALRDLPSQYRTNNVIDINLVKWPEM